MSAEWDCVVVGGGAAGLSAALVLGRARRRTLVIDLDEQSNRASAVLGGLLGYDGRPPAELYAAGRRELAAYPSVEYRVGEATDGARTDTGLTLEPRDGVTVEQRRLVEVVGETGELDELVFAEGPPLRRDGLLVTAPLRQRTPLAEKLGARCASGPLSPEQICVDNLFRTDSADVFAAGDVCTEHPHVAGAIAAGSNAAMIVVQSLLADDVGLPYPPS